MRKLDRVREEARRILDGGRGSHDWEHTERVCNMALHLAAFENADPEIVEAAALLHDIGRHEQDRAYGKVSHEILSSEMARPILESIGYQEDMILRILHCIESHRYRQGSAPGTVEARVLFDADKLDAIGAIGIGRAFVFAGEVGAAVHIRNLDVENTKSYTREDTAYREFKVKLEKIKDRIYTSEGKRIAGERHEYMVSFFKRLDGEAEGRI
ncbi:MAG: HD domain-containing protein [Clostridia bacterium]|nr:HD domain-containing protein [Clostridia bacterium]